MAGPRSGLHPSERQANMLSAAIKDRVDALAYGITPKGARPPFTVKKSPAEIQAWWLKHRYDKYGQQVVAGMTPMQVAQLDAWLTQVTAHPSMQQTPQQGQPMQMMPGVESILTQAMGAERRMQGAPIGDQVA